MTTITQLQTRRDQLAQTRIASRSRPTLSTGEVLLRIDRLAVTSNNITYAAFGDVPHLRYWDFFPTDAPDWGHMPAWGFATVESSTVPGVEEGARYDGYWPIATHDIVQPVRVTERGFYDGRKHRQSLTSAYNQYQRCTTDAAYRPETEDLQCLLRPLFITSFMLADFLEDNAFFGAEQLLYSSASSKTAFGTAFCLRHASPGQTGMTSAGHQAFVQALGCYDTSLDYGGLSDLDATRPTVYVDFSGRQALRQQVHQHFDQHLTYSCFAGSAQSQDFLTPEQAAALPGPKPELYFAPYQIRKRNADWGAAEVTRRFNQAQLAFYDFVRDPQHSRLTLTEHSGLPATQSLVAALVNGRIDPQQGHIVRPQPA